ncbi:MAG: hypothetical protein EA359_05315 [Balneolaceae bacterium]|nr:MAG: hypothetical protein EA359_05315 [Balneolaceae bacterium]
MKLKLEPSGKNLYVRKRAVIVVLLFFSCIAAVVLLWIVEPPQHTPLSSPAQIDSLIKLTFDEFQLAQSQVRMQTVKVDSIFSRNIYSVRVPRDFSKTSFHYQLHNELLPYQAKTIGHVEFPDRNLRIHVVVNNKVHRSVFINTDPLLHNILHQ